MSLIPTEFMLRSIIASLLLLFATLHLGNLNAIEAGSKAQSLSALLEAALYFMVPIWMLLEARKIRKNPHYIKKTDLKSWGVHWIKNPIHFTQSVYEERRPAFLPLAMWLMGIAHFLNVMHFSIIGNPAMEYANNWLTVWGMALISGFFMGWLLYYIGGVIAYGLIRISGGKMGFYASANLFIFSNLYLYLGLIVGTLLRTAIFGDRYFYGHVILPIDIAIKVFIFSAAFISLGLFFKLACQLGQAKKRGLLFLLAIPLAVLMLWAWMTSFVVFLSEGSVSNRQGLRALEQGNVQEAETLFEKSIDEVKQGEDQEELVKAYMNRAILHEAKGEIQEAIGIYQEALSQLSPNSAAHQTFQGLIAFDEGRTVDSIPLFKTALESNPDDFNANNRLGLIYMGRYDAKLKDLEAALAYNQKAYALNGEDPSVIQNLAINYYDLSRYEEAVPLFEALVKRIPNNILSKYLLGMTYYKTGELENAKASLKEAVAANPQLLTDEVEEILNEK